MRIINLACLSATGSLIFTVRALAATPGAYASPPSPREAFLAAAFGGIIACGLTSFVLAGRIAERTHVALALITVLIAAFCLFVLFGLAGRQEPSAGALIVLALVALFKLMNQFEMRRDRGRPRP